MSEEVSSLMFLARWSMVAPEVAFSTRKVFRIGTVTYNWPMSAHASQAFSIAHRTDSEDLPSSLPGAVSIWITSAFPSIWAVYSTSKRCRDVTVLESWCYSVMWIYEYIHIYLNTSAFLTKLCHLILNILFFWLGRFKKISDCLRCRVFTLTSCGVDCEMCFKGGNGYFG